MFQQDNLDKYTTISYHMSWPGVDPFHNFNISEANTRRGYYLVSWVPWFVSNGNNTLNETGGIDDWKANILSQAATSAPIGLSIAGSFDGEQRLATAMVTIDPETGSSGEYTLHFVLVEDDLYHAGSTTSDDMHQAVMRDMIPNAAGTPISLAAGVEFVKQFKIGINSNFVPENCRLVAFVQAADGTILNAANEHLTTLPSPPLPLLSVVGTEISVNDDDGDMKLNRGETANYLVRLANECNWEGASNIKGILVSNDPNVTVLDSVASFGDLTACEDRTNLQSAFRFKVADDAPAVTDLNMTLKVMTQDGGSLVYVPYEQSLSITEKIDRFRLHFPVGNRQPLTTGNAVVDLDGDGMSEVVICGLDSLVHVYENDGSEASGFPFQLGHVSLGSPAVADIDNDGDLEIVVTSQDKQIYVIQHDGSGEPVAEASSILMSTPALDDLDGDGDLEIVAGSFASEMLVFHHDGAAYAGFPYTLTGEIIAKGAAIADLDGDGNKDIIFGTWKGKLHAVDATGNSLPGFPIDSIAGAQHSLINSPPVITDLDGDGSVEILLGQDKGVLVALSDTGKVLWSRQMSTGRIRTSVAIADFDRDMTVETVVNTLDGNITILDHLGNDVQGWPQTLGDGFYSSPVIADLNGDTYPEIIAGSNSGELFAFNYDGSLVDDFPVPLSTQAQGTPTIADIDNDGWLEIILGTDADLSVVETKLFGSIDGYWSTARGDLQRTGFLLAAAPFPAISNVYPGDTDNDGDVDEYDILPIGVYFLEQGELRQNSSLLWNKQQSMSWDSYPANYADCNGDGVVDERDVIAIGVNWGAAHDMATERSRHPIDISDAALMNQHLGSFEELYSAIQDTEGYASVAMKRILESILSIQPNDFVLHQNHPNPFNPSTSITYSLPTESIVSLTVFDVLGHEVFTIYDGKQNAGNHTVVWSGAGVDGIQVPAGVYFAQLISGSESRVIKMMLVR